MRRVYAGMGAALWLFCGCAKPSHTEGSPQSGAGAEASAETGGGGEDAGAIRTPSTIEHRAGTYDPARDPAPAAGPGAPHVGDVPGTGLTPIDAPVQTPPPQVPTPPLGAPRGSPAPQ